MRDKSPANVHDPRRLIVVPELQCPSMVLSVWYVKPGESVLEGDRVVELLLGNAIFDVLAPKTGTLIEQHAGPQDLLRAGQVMGVIALPAETEE